MQQNNRTKLSYLTLLKLYYLNTKLSYLNTKLAYLKTKLSYLNLTNGIIILTGLYTFD